MRIGFSGYAFDCTISGEVELEVDRLKDQLDQHRQLVVFNATLESLDDGRSVCVRRLELDRHDLLAAVAVPPRGPRDRRIRTVRHRIFAEVGPYTVAGELHEKPGTPPMGDFHGARPMVSFTDASISYMQGGRSIRRRIDAVLVNRERVGWIGPDVSEMTGPGPTHHVGADGMPPVTPGPGEPSH